MADVVTNAFLEGQATAKINFNDDTFKCALLHIVPRPADSQFIDVVSYAQLSAFELSAGNGYDTYGISVTTSAYIDPTSKDVVYACSSPTWIASAGTIGPVNYAAIYDTTVDNTVVYVYDFLKDYTAYDGSALSINIDSNGLVRAKRTCT